MSKRPDVEDSTLKLRPMIHGDRGGQSALLGNSVEHSRNPRPRDRGVNLEGETLAAEVIHYRQAAQSPTVHESISDKVHRPALIQSGRTRQLHAFIRPDALALPTSNR